MIQSWFPYFVLFTIPISNFIIIFHWQQLSTSVLFVAHRLRAWHSKVKTRSSLIMTHGGKVGLSVWKTWDLPEKHNETNRFCRCLQPIHIDLEKTKVFRWKRSAKAAMCPYGKLLDGTPKISTALAPMTAITGWTELRTGTNCIFPVEPLIFKRFEEFESPHLSVIFPVISEIFWVPSGKCQGGPYEKTKRERWGEGGRHPLGVVRILVGGCYQPRKWEFTSKHQHLSQLMMESGLSQYHDWRNPFNMGNPWLVYAGFKWGDNISMLM